MQAFNLAELCRQEGIYIQQLVRWIQEILKGAEESLKRRPKRTKEHDSEKEYLKQELSQTPYLDWLRDL